MGIRIIGTGMALPEKKVVNDDLAAFMDTSDEWIFSKTGIKSRFVCTKESLTDISEQAARVALGKAGITAGEIDMIICTTVGAELIIPSLACCVSERLSANCPAFDINVACSGFVYALDIAAAFLALGKARHILIISAEIMSNYVDWSDRRVSVLFGDGAGACVVAKGNALKYINLTACGDTKPLFLKSVPGNSPFKQNNEDKLPVPEPSKEFLYMNGQEVFKFAVQALEREVKLALDTLSLSEAEIDYYVLHQANKRIIDSLISRLKLPPDKFPINIDKYGNMSSASVPILLDEMLSEGRIRKGDTLLLATFGAGMATGTCILVWE